jgi:NADPH:quinone reductase-like Zn-dependent oxidoreductase
MKAVRCRAPASLGNLVLGDKHEPPRPAAGEITVCIDANSLNFHDYAVVTGQLPTADGRIPMSDGAGRVVAVGPGSSEFRVGDMVVSLFFPLWVDGELSSAAAAQVPGDSVDGYACEFVTVAASWFTRVPQGYTALEAATLPCAALTAWRALVTNGRLRTGEIVLVMGTGGVLVFALQFAKAMGATVIATSSSDLKAERLMALGADHVVNYKDVPKWGSKILEITAGRGVDHVVEIGGAGTLGQSIAACRPAGHIALVGVLAGLGGPVNTAAIMRKQLRIEGLTVGSRTHQLEMIHAIDRFGIKPILDRCFPMADLAEAFRYQERSAHLGKIAIDVAGGQA